MSQRPPKVLIIQGNPDPNSLCQALAEAYNQGAQKTNAEVREIKIRDIEFNPNLPFGYKQELELEEGLIEAQRMIQWADHLVFIYPTWWGTMPALMKGFVDKVFVPGFGFKYRKGSVWWDKLLKGKSARLIVTMDTPPWYFRLVYGQPGHRAMKRTILGFCGVKPVRISSIGPVKPSKKAKRMGWLNRVERLGQGLA
ncbi:MAG: NAD(P)H-dependent oxidoreductase [Proteobacteria bacterium]|nr:NAD(P)H-dependent oxidoreductase [Pseudomonadota bacterium]